MAEDVISGTLSLESPTLLLLICLAPEVIDIRGMSESVSVSESAGRLVGNCGGDLATLVICLAELFRVESMADGADAMASVPEWKPSGA